MKRNTELEEKLPLYALGALDESEMNEIDAYIQHFPDVAKELNRLKDAAGLLPFAAETMSPPPSIKSAVMGHAEANPRKSTRTSEQKNLSLWDQLKEWWHRVHVGPALPVGFAVAVLALGIVTAQLFTAQSSLDQSLNEKQQLNSELDELKVENEALALQNRLLLQELESQDQLIAYAADASSQRLTIPGTEAQPAASGGLFIRPDTNELLLVLTNLQPLSEEQIYQLWLIEEIPVSAGLIEITPDGTGIFKIDLDSGSIDFSAIGVSVEPMGGSEQPTGDIVLFGEV